MSLIITVPDIEISITGDIETPIIATQPYGNTVEIILNVIVV